MDRRIESTAEPCTTVRFERKFVVPPAAVPSILDSCNTRLLHTTFGRDAFSHVVSLYFDTACLASCRETIDGAIRRCKVRLRWYDGSDDAFLEVKSRHGDVVVKQRAAVRRPNDAPVRPPEPSELPDAIRQALMHRPLATAVVGYRRWYFRSPDDTWRLTVDDGLSCGLPTELGMTWLNPRQPLSWSVVEVKHGIDAPFPVVPVAGGLGLRCCGRSKYLAACRALGLLDA